MTGYAGLEGKCKAEKGCSDVTWGMANPISGVIIMCRSGHEQLTTKVESTS